MEILRPGAALPYAEALRIMEERRAGVAAGTLPEAIIACGHPPTVTLGRAYRGPDPPLPEGFALFRVDRGGEATYHGPGQVVCYPIVDLRPRGRNVRGHLRALEAAVLDVLAATGVAGRTIPGRTGVYVAERKIASIGIAVRGWVTTHGVALNVDPDLSHFRCIRPCGLDPEAMTSLRAVLSRPVDLASVEDVLVSALRARLGA